MQQFLNLGNLFWLFFVFSALSPLIQQRLLEVNRWRLLSQIQRARGSSVIALIHRQETVSFLGIPVARYIDIDDSEEVLRAIHLTPSDVPIDLILHTPGGLLLAATQIAHALIRHPAPVRVIVPHYAMSGGTFIALAANEILMDANAVLGPVDPQLSEYPAASVLSVLDAKPPDRITDKTLMLADVSRKALNQAEEKVREILQTNGMDPAKASRLGRILATGTWTHDYPIFFEQATDLGLPVIAGLPPQIYPLMRLYHQPRQKRPSVEFVAIPHNRAELQ